MLIFYAKHTSPSPSHIVITFFLPRIIIHNEGKKYYDYYRNKEKDVFHAQQSAQLNKGRITQQILLYLYRIYFALLHSALITIPIRTPTKSAGKPSLSSTQEYGHINRPFCLYDR